MSTNTSVNEKMTALADEIRELSGITGKIGLDAMATNVSDANDEIAEQTDLLSQIATALEGKASGSGGVELPTLNTPASASDILKGKQAIDSAGEVITGTIETRSVDNLFVNGANITTTAGYYPEDVYQSVTKTTLATPSISVDSSGLITSMVQQQTSGYIAASYKQNTKQLTTQAAKTITPTTSSQTAVASGRYTTGTVTVAAIPSNYEDVGTETSAYTTKLTTLETAITALETELQGKASGGSGGVETCNVTITSDNGSIRIYGFTIFENNSISAVGAGIVGSSIPTPITVNNVVCGSLIILGSSYTYPGFSATNGSLQLISGSNPRYLKLTAAAGSSVIINCYNGD